MARDSNGNYSLFTPGNPVVTLTVISSSWANSTMSDLATAMTASLDRSGNGGMLAGLKAFAGTIGAPGLTWSAETTSGWYRAAAGDFRYAIGGQDRMTITAALISWSVNIQTSGSIVASNTNPTIAWNETDGAANNRRWDISVNAEALTHRMVDDAISSATAWCTVNRTLNVCDDITFAATAISLNGAVTTTGNLVVSNTGPLTRWNETDAAANNRVWDVFINAELFSARVVNDALGAATTWLAVNRTLNVVDDISLTATAINMNAGVTFTQSGLVAAPIVMSSVFPNIVWNETDAAANNRRWDIVVNGEQFVARVADDAISAATSWMIVDRTLNVVDIIAFTATNFNVTAATHVGGTGAAFSATPNLSVQAAGATNFGVRNTTDSVEGLLRADTASVIVGAVTNHSLELRTNNTSRITVAANGDTALTAALLTAANIHNGTATGATAAIASGTYTPTITSTVNLDSTTPHLTNWIRVGNIVHVAGVLTVNPTINASISFRMSLPIASNFANTFELGGTAATSVGSSPNAGGVIANVANDVADFLVVGAGGSVVDTEMSFTFSYVVK